MQRFYANMKWFDVAEQPQGFDSLPPEFAQAKRLWDDDSEGNIQQILEMLAPFVGACFIPTNISGGEELFADPDGNGFLVIESKDVNLTGIDFSRWPIPKCKAEAIFKVQVKDDFASTDLDDWQENNGRFTDAVAFCWNIERDSNTADLDFTFGDNLGVECIALNGDLP